jgi:catechol 2,3-dioxygenase-like lactoylglutathione lyase family enzyme
MHLVHRQEGTAPYLSAVTGFPGVRLQVALLKRTPDDPHTLELLHYVSHPAEPTDRATNRPGNGHLCFRVDDLHTWYQHLSAQGVKFLSPPVPITAGINTGAYAVYLRDPDGFTIESEYRPQAGGLLSEAPSKGALETSFLIRFLLFADILLHTLQFEPYGGHRVAACPEVLTGEIPLFLLHSPRNSQGTLPFQKPYH